MYSNTITVLLDCTVGTGIGTTRWAEPPCVHRVHRLLRNSTPSVPHEAEGSRKGSVWSSGRECKVVVAVVQAKGRLSTGDMYH